MTLFALTASTYAPAALAGTSSAQGQRISGAWKRPHALDDGVPRLMILYVRETSNGNWNLFYDMYVGNERVAHNILFPRWDQDSNVLVDGELRFSEACYNVKGTVSADGNTLNLAYTLRPHHNCPNAKQHKEEVLKYTR